MKTLMVLFGGNELKVVGIMYLVGMPILCVMFYGPMAMLMAFVNSKMANSFGGLEIILEDTQLRHLVNEVADQQVDNVILD